MRADRLLNILLILQEGPRVTAGEVARRLEVSARTIHRDMEALGMAGIPVYAERGRDGGYALLDSFRADLHYLTGAEIQALFVHNPAILKDLGLRPAAESAVRKLQQALPDRLGHDAARVRRHMLVDGAGWRQTAEEHPYLALMHDALWQARQVRMRYSRADGETRERTVHPLGLVAKGRLWYLVAGVNETAREQGAGHHKGQTLAADAGADAYPVRTYRISRIEAVEMLEEPAFIPPDFDLSAYWEASSSRFMANLPHYPVTIWASPRAVARLPSAGWYVQIEGHGETRADAWQQVQLAFHTAETAIACLAGLGDQIEVIQPEEVQAGIVAVAEGILRQADKL